jgi:hypothetical protein
MKTESKLSLSQILNNYIDFYELRVSELMVKLESDYLYQLPWLGEEIYKYKYTIAYYKSMLNDLQSETDGVVLGYHTRMLLNYCKRAYNVRENSTGTLHREVSTWKFQCNLEILEKIEQLTNNN